MRVIDHGAAQIGLVVDEQQRLLGTLTDGDIRRGLLHGETLDTPVERLMNRQFRSVRIGEDQEAVVEMMRREVLHQIPVLDAVGRVVKLLLLQELLAPVQLPNAIVIMAGGKGTRLRPHTEHCPKPMLPVHGKPMLEILLEQCIASGFCQFYLSVNYLKEQIINHFGDGKRWGVSIEYLVEDEPLGTAGSLQLLPRGAGAVSGNEWRCVIDTNPCQLLRFHLEHELRHSLRPRAHHNCSVWSGTSGVWSWRVLREAQLPPAGERGVYVIDPKLLPLLPAHQATDMPTLLESAQQSGHRVVVCPIHEYWIDVGRPETLRQAHEEWPTVVGP